MITVMLFVGGMIGTVVGLTIKLRRRGGVRGESADELRIEQARREQASGARTSYSSINVRSTFGLTTEDLHKYHR
ncbi:hypothetical protein AAHZ94_06300 [Streptomyces sp. HSW2009]|uniref:hypothetical protein n=1 Tax=Streptomyces sp. HSW2009 TaxID=3142890 RepID=UPI0032EFE955